jgi:putative endonuclease
MRYNTGAMNGTDDTAGNGWFCYLLACADGTLYTGVTNDVARRLAMHNRGTASKYTRSRRPVRLVHSEPCGDRSAALKREAAIRRLSPAAKRALAKPD